MINKYLFLALCIAGFLWFPAGASAESQKMYRYTDASGKRFVVFEWEEIPSEYRLSASTVVVAKDMPAPKDQPASKDQPAPREDVAGAEAGTANGNTNTVTVLSFALAPTENGLCAFSGEVKNGMKDKAENVKLHLEVKSKDGMKSYDVPVGAGGAMNAGETAKVAPVTEVPAAALAGYAYNLTWQAIRLEAVPANPEQGQKPPQAAAPKQ